MEQHRIIMGRWTFIFLVIAAALLCTAAVSAGFVHIAQVVLGAVLGLMIFTFFKGLGHHGAP